MKIFYKIIWPIILANLSAFGSVRMILGHVVVVVVIVVVVVVVVVVVAVVVSKIGRVFVVEDLTNGPLEGRRELVVGKGR